MLNRLFGSSNNKWDSMRSHQTWRIRNRPININDEYILYSTDFKVGENGIVQYNVTNNRFTITKYPVDIKPEYHSYCKYENYIYIINTNGTIITYNLQTKLFKHIKNIKNKPTIGRYSSCINIEGTGEIHIFGGLENQYHLIYSIHTKSYSQKQDFGAKMENPCVLYLKNERKIFVFNGYVSNNFFIGSITHNNNDIKWEISALLQIPNAVRDCGYILYKNKYVIIFGGCNYKKEYSDDIYIVNLLNGKQNKLENIQCPMKDRYHAILINNKIHLFGLWNHTKHHSLHMNKLPIEINVENDEKWDNDRNIENRILQMQQMEEKQEEKEEALPGDDEEKQFEVVENDNDKELNNLRKQIDILSLEKEKQGERIMFLEEENNKLKRELFKYKNENNVLDLTKYILWDPNTIVSWILTIEKGLLSDYESILLKKLSDDGIEGNDLYDINTHSDWKQYGINKYGHRKLLIQYVNSLVEHNKVNEEGKKTPHI